MPITATFKQCPSLKRSNIAMESIGIAVALLLHEAKRTLTERESILHALSVSLERLINHKVLS
jgi:hypothetical protein